MYEDLVKRLRAYSAEHQKHGGITAKAADAIEELCKAQEQWIAQERNALLRSIPRWIPVTERMPEDNTEVLAYYGFVLDGEMSGCRFMGVVKYFTINANPHWQHEVLGLTVTHWMPLPQPPTEGSQMVTDINQVQEDEDNGGIPQ